MPSPSAAQLARSARPGGGASGPCLTGAFLRAPRPPRALCRPAWRGLAPRFPLLRRPLRLRRSVGPSPPWLLSRPIS
eukprot:3779022-Alexandrium_andersonii.AAC.1